MGFLVLGIWFFRYGLGFDKKSFTVFGGSLFLSLPHQDAGLTASSFLAGFVVLLFVKMLPEPVSFGGGAGCFLSHGLSASAVFVNRFCDPCCARLIALG